MSENDPLDDERPQGDGNGSISERAASGETAEPEGPPIMEAGGVQLSMNIGGVVSNRNARKVTGAGIVIQGGAQAVDSLLDIDTEYDLVVRVLPDAPIPSAQRDSNRKTKSFEMRQPCQASSIRRGDTAEAITDLFSTFAGRDQVAAQKLLRDLGEVVKGAKAA